MRLPGYRYRRSIGPKLRFRVLERCGFACVYCGGRPPMVELVIDHVVPVSKGGRDTDDNLVAACRDCNAGKSDRNVSLLPPTPPADAEEGDDESVVAWVTLERHRDGYDWVVLRCPYCGRRHTHGGGRLDGDPRRKLGHRISHCGPPNGQDYRLVELVS